jgi:saccharopine dehydrogenase-like NADP-dependent oxidoreductase
MEAYQTFLDRYDKPFKKIGKTLLGSSGISPGLINLIARYTMTYLDSCETIKMIFNEGLLTKKYIPFWWAPATALETTQMPSRTFVNGKLIFSKPYSGELYRTYPETGNEVVVYEHAHPEPVTIGYHSKDYYKDVQNVFFKYGGIGMEFAKPLLELGLLSQVTKEYHGQSITPYDFIVDHLPPAPKYPNEIKEYIDSGIIKENSAIVVESTGTKDGKRIMIEAHVYSPGIEEAFEKMEFSSEMYSTGMSGALFTKMLLEEKVSRTGVVTSDMFSHEEIDCFFKFAEEVGITFELLIKDPIDDENPFIPIEVF